MKTAPVTLDAAHIDFAHDYEAKFGRVILAYLRPNAFLTNHGYMSTDLLVGDATKMYSGMDINPIAIVAKVAQTFLEHDRETDVSADQSLADDCKDILFWRMLGEDPAELLEEVRRLRWRRESTSRLYSRLGSYSDERYCTFKEDIDAIRGELARRDVTETSWGRRASPISFD